jgi:hypothetical protein
MTAFPGVYDRIIGDNPAREFVLSLSDGYTYTDCMIQSFQDAYAGLASTLAEIRLCDMVLENITDNAVRKKFFEQKAHTQESLPMWREQADKRLKAAHRYIEQTKKNPTAGNRLLISPDDAPPLPPPKPTETLPLQRANPSRSDTPGFVYFIERELDHAIKIGFSTEPEKRLRALMTAAGPCELLHTIPAPMRHESELHARFEAHRIDGEWFRPHPDILRLIMDAINEGIRPMRRQRPDI